MFATLPNGGGRIAVADYQSDDHPRDVLPYFKYDIQSNHTVLYLVHLATETLLYLLDTTTTRPITTLVARNGDSNGTTTTTKSSQQPHPQQ